jgi:AcrR family transcriptional regulator
MREWIPTRASAKGRLVLAALEAFGRQGYHGVGVAELAKAAETTTGPLYHHFGSKLGLYDVVRSDVERRILDRMEGALAVPERPGDDRVATALVVAFDYAVRAGVARLLSEPHPGGRADAVAALLTERLDGGATPLGAMLAAAWRAALAASADGADADAVRTALKTLRVTRPRRRQAGS